MFGLRQIVDIGVRAQAFGENNQTTRGWAAGSGYRNTSEAATECGVAASENICGVGAPQRVALPSKAAHSEEGKER